MEHARARADQRKNRVVALTIIFWISLAIIAWETVIFPAVLKLLARLRPKTSVTADITPSVSIVISVHNEAGGIAAKLANTLAFDYPSEAREIIVIDDGSTDSTVQVVTGYADRGVQLFCQEGWHGKTAAQNRAVAQAKGDIILFSDATATYNDGALRQMVRHFADPGIGCVTGHVTLAEPAADDGSGALTKTGAQGRLRYEHGVRKAQGDAFSLFGATGCIYAVRRDLYVPLPEDQVSDLVLPLLLLEKGYRTVYEPAAIATLARPVSAEREFARRSRVVLQCLRAMWYMRRLLIPKPAMAMLAVVSWYRLLRWLLPVFLITCLATNIALAISAGGIYSWLLAAQAVLYGLALLGGLLELAHVQVPVVGLPFFFVWINAAAAAGLVRLALGEKGRVWNTAR
jgi:cellulose synthase/poly-beta-1,6-N-acetylglucosamine synthase-like glycosyltransferase